MSDLSESAVQSIVRGEVSSLRGEVKRLESSISKIEARLNELHSLQNDIHATVIEIMRMHDQMKGVANITQAVHQTRALVEEVKIRVQHVEESARYTAGYVAMRLKERYEREAH